MQMVNKLGVALLISILSLSCLANINAYLISDIEADTVTIIEKTGRTTPYMIASYDAPQHIKDDADEIAPSSGAQLVINDALDNYGSVYLMGGTFSTNESIVMDGVYNSITLSPGTTISFDASGDIEPVITMSANYQTITSDGMGVIRYSSQPNVGSGGYGIQIVGSCGHCQIENLLIYKTNYGFRCDKADFSNATLWNSVITNIDIRMSNEGNWHQRNYSSSGNVFNNLYLNNSEQDENTNNYTPVLLYYSTGSTVVFNQLNLEWTDNIEGNLINISNVGHCVINGMHWEGLTVESYTPWYYSSWYGGSLTINGWMLYNCKFQSASGGNIGFTSLITAANVSTGQGSIIINGLSIPPNCDFSKVNNMYLVDDRGDTPTKIWCRGCPDSSVFTDIVRVADSGTGESGLKEYN